MTQFIQELCIGICGCTSLWHGKLGGLKLTVNEVSNGVLNPPLSIKLTEVSIPEDEEDHIEAAADRGCHLFLDIVPEEDGTILEIVRFVTPTHVECCGRGGWGRKEWYEGNPPYPMVIMQGIRKIIHDLKVEQIQPWIARQPLPPLP